MSVASKARGLGTQLFCAACDNEVPEGVAACPYAVRSGGGRNTVACGSRAFYRGRRPMRHLMGPPLPDDPAPIEAGAPKYARRDFRGRRMGAF